MRNSRILLPLCLLVSIVSAGQTQSHDLKITTRRTYSGMEPPATTSTAYYSGENSRSEMQIVSGNVKGHRRAIIRRRSAENIQVYDLDLDAHKYVSYQTDLHGSVPGLAPRSFAGKPSGKTYQMNVDVVDTGERKEMFGHIARHLITHEKRIGGPGNCYAGAGSEKDGWYIDEDLLPAAARWKPAMATAIILRFVSTDNQSCSDKIETHRTGPPTGFPLDETTTWSTEVPPIQNAGFARTETLEFVEAPLNPALFQVPPHFKKVKEIIDPTQRRSRP